MMKFSPEEDRIYALFDPAFCEYHSAGEPFLMLAGDKRHGETTVHVITDCPCLHIRDLDTKWEKGNLAPFLMKESVIRKSKEKLEDPTSQCADHVIFLYDAEHDRWNIHIFEMKTTMGVETWKGVKRQWSGALYRSYAIGGILMRNQGFQCIQTHCVYKQNWNESKQNDMTDLEAAASGLSTDAVDSAAGSENEWALPEVHLNIFPEITIQNKEIRLDMLGRAAIKLTRNGCVNLSV